MNIITQGYKKVFSWEPTEAPLQLNPERTAVVVVDTWNTHWCKTFAKRTQAIKPQMEKTLTAFRKLGIPIIFMGMGESVRQAYKGTPQRLAMISIPSHKIPEQTNIFIPKHLPWSKWSAADDGCECSLTNTCKRYPVRWIRRILGLTINQDDFIGEDVQELYSFCREKQITHLIYIGGALNLCLFSQPHGILSIQRLGLQCLIVKDLCLSWLPNYKDNTEQRKARIIEFYGRYFAWSINSEQIIKLAEEQ